MPIRTQFKLKEIGPADAAVPIVGDASANYSGLYIGGGGNVQVLMANGATATFVGVASGTFMPINVAAVIASATTATNILGLN